MHSRDKRIIKSIFIAEFHQNVGPKIVAQHPLKPINFSSLSEYVILKPELCGRLIAIRDADNDWVVGSCVCLRHEKFPRNSLVFNVCLVVDGDSNFRSFENIVQKLSEYMAELELESQFVSTRLEDSTLSPSLESILTQIYSSLNDDGFCVLPVDAQNVWYLKIDPVWDEPIIIKDHHVPVPLVDMNDGLITCFQWKDLAIQSILPFINGTNFVRRIALLANEDLATVTLALQHLAYYRLVSIQDIFQYTNMYQVTKKICEFTSSWELQDACLRSVALQPSLPLPDISLIFALYCQLKPGTPLCQFCTDHELEDLNIDVRSFIMFGTLHGIIRRVHKYPLERSTTTFSSVINSPFTSIIPPPRVSPLKSSNSNDLPVSVVEEKSLKESYDGILEARETLDSLGMKRRLNLKMNKGHVEFLAQVEEFLRDVAYSGNCSYDELSTELGLSYGELDELFSLSFYK